MSTPSENPCERCGFEIHATDRSTHSEERDCYRAASEAAFEWMRQRVAEAALKTASQHIATGTHIGEAVGDAFEFFADLMK